MPDCLPAPRQAALLPSQRSQPPLLALQLPPGVGAAQLHGGETGGLQLGYDVGGGDSEVVTVLRLGLGPVGAQGAALVDAVKYWGLGPD